MQQSTLKAGPRGNKKILCLTQLSIKFILLINDKMPTIVVGNCIVSILTFISMITTSPKNLKAKKTPVFFMIISISAF